MKKKWEVRYFGIQPYEEIATKEMPKQAECAAIITSDSCGFTFWAEDFSQIHIFVTYNKSGLIDSYRVEYGDTPIYDDEVEISFDDLYERAEEDYRETYRADIPGTVEYDRKREAAQVEQTAAEAAEDTNAAGQDAEQTTETACKGEETAGEDGTPVLDRNQRRAYNPVVAQQRVQANFRRRGRT